MDEKEGLDEEAAASDAWNRHLYRNESIITDLFHGQFKSTVKCSLCDRVSITFDPMMTMLLPIPGKKSIQTLFFVPYNISSGYVNYSAKFSIRPNVTLETLRELMREKYKVPKASFTVTKVHQNEFNHYFNCSSTVEMIQNEHEGLVLCYEIDPSLNPSFDNLKSIDKRDSNNGVSDEFTRLSLGLAKYEKQQYS